MNKTGNLPSVYIRLLFLFILSLIGSGVSAQDFTLEATVSENRVFTGEQFTLNVEVSGTSMRDVSLPVLPDIDGLRVLSTTPSRSTSISIVNGRTTSTTSYTYTLIARDTGHFTIPPISVTIDNEEVQTEPVRIEVIEKGNLSPDGGPQLPDIFVEVEVDDKTPVPGQQIVASIAIYFKQGIEVTSFQPSAGWRTDGFWKEELDNLRQPRAESVILNNVRYRKATLMRYALFPTRSGELTLTTFTLNAGIRTQPSRNDPFGSFFGGSGTNQRRVTIESDPIVLQVQSLPSVENALSINAVGNLRVKRELTRNEITSGETIELITTVEGAGNIPLVRKPNYNLPDRLDLYSPEENSQVQRRGETIQGEKKFTELMTARVPGTYNIPAERVAIYNPDNRQYRYVTLPAMSFEVLPGTDGQIAASGSSLRLQPVSGLATWYPASPEPFYNTFWFWILLALPAVALIAGTYQKSLQKRLATDSLFARAHHASDRAYNQINKAKAHLDEPKLVYNHIHKAVTGFISDKLGLPEAGFSDEVLLEKLEQKGCSDSLLKKVRTLLTKCATISYAPTEGRGDLQADITKTEHIISELKKLL
ncbi:MAG: BatD family protein [Balneolaceae bacterium]